MIKINLLAERPAAPSKVRVPRIEVGASAENLLYAAILVLALVFCGGVGHGREGHGVLMHGAAVASKKSPVSGAYQ